MKAVLQYTAEDLRRLVSEHATSLGYAVLPEEVDMPDDITVSVQFEGVPRPPTPVQLAQTAGEAPEGATPGPPRPPASKILPSQEGAWTSQPARGGDPRYVPIEPPTFAPRVPRVREVGQDTGLVRRETGTEDGRPRGWQPPSTERDPEAPPDGAGIPEFGETADFLDEYITSPRGR